LADAQNLGFDISVYSSCTYGISGFHVSSGE
jgi:hypothetical protein